MAVFDAFPMPHVTKLVERIGSAKFISTLDLAKGYWQILLMPRDQPKTAFGTPWGLYEFVRMPSGLHGAAATFQRLMEHILVPHTQSMKQHISMTLSSSHRHGCSTNKPWLRYCRNWEDRPNSKPPKVCNSSKANKIPRIPGGTGNHQATG